MRSPFTYEGVWEKDFSQFKVEVRESLAKKLYNHFRSLRATNEFPYDTNQGRSHDDRKIYAPPYHLWSQGGAFVGSKKVAGHYYRGPVPMASDTVISIIFTNPKQMKSGRIFDYAKKVLDEYQTFDVYPTDSELSTMIDEALNEAL